MSCIPLRSRTRRMMTLTRAASRPQPMHNFDLSMRLRNTMIIVGKRGNQHTYIDRNSEFADGFQNIHPHTNIPRLKPSKSQTSARNGGEKGLQT